MRIFAFCTLALISSVTYAAPVTVEVEVNISSYFDYLTKSFYNMPIAQGVVSFTFDIDQRSVVDYGTTTISTFGGIMGTTWSSPVTSLIPSDPYSGAYGKVSSSYVFPNVSDYASTFIEQGAAQANTYLSNGNSYAAYHIEVRASRYSASRGGDGTSDFAYDRLSLLDLFRSFEASGEAVYFNESYQTYTIEDGSVIYSDGKSWSDYAGRVISVTDHAAVVPEPPTAVLLASGLIALLYGKSRRRLNVNVNQRSLGA